MGRDEALEGVLCVGGRDLGAGGIVQVAVRALDLRGGRDEPQTPGSLGHSPEVGFQPPWEEELSDQGMGDTEGVQAGRDACQLGEGAEAAPRRALCSLLAPGTTIAGTLGPSGPWLRAHLCLPGPWPIQSHSSLTLVGAAQTPTATCLSNWGSLTQHPCPPGQQLGSPWAPLLLLCSALGLHLSPTSNSGSQPLPTALLRQRWSRPPVPCSPPTQPPCPGEAPGMSAGTVPHPPGGPTGV